MLHLRPFRYALRNLITAVSLCLGVWAASPGNTAEPFTAGIVISPPTGWTSEQTPIDFLDVVGLQTKARWRQLYRPPPPTPSLRLTGKFQHRKKGCRECWKGKTQK